jgi:peroxiredoxin Q/BCP
VGVSRDTVKAQAKFKEKNDLPFPLLSDPDGAVCEKYGVIKAKTMFGKKVKGIERSTFVIGADGKVERILRKVKVAGHVAEVLAGL